MESDSPPQATCEPYQPVPTTGYVPCVRGTCTLPQAGEVTVANSVVGNSRSGQQFEGIPPAHWLSDDPELLIEPVEEKPPWDVDGLDPALQVLSLDESLDDPLDDADDPELDDAELLLPLKDPDPPIEPESFPLPAPESPPSLDVGPLCEPLSDPESLDPEGFDPESLDIELLPLERESEPSEESPPE